MLNKFTRSALAFYNLEGSRKEIDETVNNTIIENHMLKYTIPDIENDGYTIFDENGTRGLIYMTEKYFLDYDFKFVIDDGDNNKKLTFVYKKDFDIDKHITAIFLARGGLI